MHFIRQGGRPLGLPVLLASLAILIIVLLVAPPSAFARSNHTKVKAPSPRRDSCSFVDQGTLYVLGGSAGTNTPSTPDFSIPNDSDSFYSLDLRVKVNATSSDTTGWKSVTMKGATPVSGHTCVLLPVRVLLVFGSGMKTEKPFLQAYDLKIQRWISLPEPQPRFESEDDSFYENLAGLYGHTSGLVGQYVVITGGYRDVLEDGSTISRFRTMPAGKTIARLNLDTYVLDVSGPLWMWTRFQGNTSNGGNSPSGRTFATSWVVASGDDQRPSFYLTGGLPVGANNTSAGFDGRAIWKFDPLTRKWDKDSRRLDVSAYGMAAAVLPGTSTVYFLGGNELTNGSFVTTSRTLDFGASSDGLPRIISGFAGSTTGMATAGISRHVMIAIDNSTRLAVFGGVTNLNSSTNELHFLSLQPPSVSSFLLVDSTLTVPKPQPTASTAPTAASAPPLSEPDGAEALTNYLFYVLITVLLPLFLIILVIWIQCYRLQHQNSTERRGEKVRGGKAHSDLENGEQGEKRLGIARESSAVATRKFSSSKPLPFATSALSQDTKIVEDSHRLHSRVGNQSISGGNQPVSGKWSYPPLTVMSATNRSSNFTMGNYTDDMESLLWLENRRSKSRRSHKSFETDSSSRRSSESLDMSDESSAFRSSTSYVESVGSRSSKILDVPSSSRLKWTFSQMYIPKMILGHMDAAFTSASTSASPELLDRENTAKSYRSSLDIENQMVSDIQKPEPAYGIFSYLK